MILANFSSYWMFSQPSLFGLSSFCSLSGILRHKFIIPTKGTMKIKLFWPIKAVWGWGQILNQNEPKWVYKAVANIPIYIHKEFTKNLVDFALLFFQYALLALLHSVLSCNLLWYEIWELLSFSTDSICNKLRSGHPGWWIGSNWPQMRSLKCKG